LGPRLRHHPRPLANPSVINSKNRRQARCSPLSCSSMATKPATPDSGRISHPSVSFVLSLVLLVVWPVGTFIRHLDRLPLPSLLLSIPVFSIVALYFGERTFFPARADQRMKNLTPVLRRNLRTVRFSLFRLSILTLVFYIAVTAFSTRSSFLFQTVAFCSLALSSSIGDLLAEPMFRSRPSVEPLTLKDVTVV
jgi:hypothetical protein